MQRRPPTGPRFQCGEGRKAHDAAYEAAEQPVRGLLDDACLLTGWVADRRRPIVVEGIAPVGRGQRGTGVLVRCEVRLGQDGGGRADGDFRRSTDCVAARRVNAWLCVARHTPRIFPIGY